MYSGHWAKQCRKWVQGWSYDLGTEIEIAKCQKSFLTYLHMLGKHLDTSLLFHGESTGRWSSRCQCIYLCSLWAQCHHRSNCLGNPLELHSWAPCKPLRLLQDQSDLGKSFPIDHSGKPPRGQSSGQSRCSVWPFLREIKTEGGVEWFGNYLHQSGVVCLTIWL